MPSNKIQYVLGIQADTSQAKKSIQELQNALNEITTANSKKLGLDIDLNNAAKAAQQLQQSIQSAVNVDTGRLNFTAFNKSLMQSNTNLNQLITQLRSTGGLGNQAVSQLARSLSTAEIPVKRMTGLLGNFATTLANSFKWQISSNIIHGMQSALSSAVGYAQDLNETLNNIRIVTGQSVDDMAKFAVSANKAAKELSTTTKEFANASLIYYQQGDSAELAAKKAATTVKAANVAFTASAKEMSEMLTAVWNSYQVGEDQLEHVVDVMAKLGATTASSMEEMATAMQKVASTANTVGISMEQMSAIVATSASVTRQAPQTVGTAWNTILSRIGGLKLGETLEDGVDLNKYSNALRTVGVNILDATGNLRDMGGVIDELGAKWQTLNKGQKAALAQTIGGARQYTQIMAFFENFDKYQKNIITAQNSTGALQEQQEIYAQGWEAASKRSRAALEELWDVLIDDEAMISFTNGMTKMTEGVTGLVKAFGGLPGILATVSALMTKTFSNQIVNGVSKATASLVGFGQAFTKQGNGQPMSGGYTIKQFLTGRMPNAEERAQISNLAVTQKILSQTAETGAGLDKENPFYDLLRQSNSLQANAYADQIQTMRQGSNLTPVQMLNLANLQQEALHTQNAYNILDAFHENTSTVSSNLINTNKGASNIFAGLSKAMYREELMKIQERATGAAGEELEAYKSQFADIAKKANINDAVFGSYKPAANTTGSDALARKFGSLEFKGLTEAERRQVIADTRQATAQSIQATRSQFNPNGQVDPASQFKAIGEAAKVAVTGITSGIAAFNQLNSAMAAFDAGNITQGLMGIATAATSVTQAFITGGLPGGLIALGTTAIGLLVNQYSASVEKLKEKAKKTADDMNKTVSQHNESNVNITNAIKEYSNLNDVLHTGSINQNEYNESLLNVANSLEIQNASVLALSEQYSALDSQIQEAIKTQLEQQEIAAKIGLSQFDQNLTDLAYNQFKDNNAVHINRHLNTLDFIGLFGDDSLNETLKQYDLGDVSKTLGVEYGSLQLNEENLRQFVTGYNQIMETVSTLNIDDQNAFQEIKIVGEEVIPGILSLISSINPLYSSIYSNQAKEFLNEKQFTSAANYDSEQRHNLTNEFLDKLGISELDPVYEVAKSAFQQIIDTAVTGFVDGGNVKAELAAAADKVRTDWEQKAKKAGVNNPGAYISEKTQGWTEQQWLNNPGFAAIYAGQSGSSTNVATAFSVQDLLNFYFAGGKGFSFETLADKIFNDTNLSTLFLGQSGLSQIDFKQLNNHEKYQALLDFIQWLITFQDDVINIANKDITKQNSEREKLKENLKNRFDATIFEGTGYTTDTFDWALLQGDIDSYQSILDQQNNGTKLNKAQEESLKRVNIFGGVQKAQQALYLYQGGIDTQSEGFLSTVDQSIDNVINNIQTLMDMDLSSSKWGESLNDIIRLLENHGISFSQWLNMSDLEKSQFRLQALKSELQELEELEAKGQSIDENHKLQLYAEIQAIEENVNNLELTNFKNRMQEITDEWDKMRENAQSALSLISSNLKNLGNLSFSDLEELRQTLLDAGLEAEHVAQILDDMRHAGEKGASKEDIWAGVMASTTAALMGITADQAQMQDVDKIVTTGTIEKIKISEEATIEPSSVTVPGEMKEVTTQGVQPPVIPTTLDANAKPVINLPNDQPVKVQLDAENNYVINLPTGTKVTVAPDANGQAVINLPSGQCVRVQPDANGQITANLPSGEEIEVQPNADGTSTINLPNGEQIIVQPNADGTSTLNLPNKEQIIVQPDANSLAVINLPTNEKVIVALDAENKDVENKPKSTVQVNTLNAEDAEVLQPKIPTLDTNVNMNYQDGDTKAKDQLKTPLQQDVELNLKISKATYDAWLMGQNAIAGSAKLMYNADDLGKEILAGNSTETTRAAYASIIGSLRQSDLTGDIVTALTQMLQSDLPEIQQLGYWLIEGIKLGIQTEEDKANWLSFLGGLGLSENVYNAFAKALGIASPSKLTMALAPYLVQGLQVGLTSSIAEWQPNVGGLADKISEAIQKELSDIDWYGAKFQDWLKDNLENYQDIDDARFVYTNTVVDPEVNALSRQATLSFLKGNNLTSNQRWALESAKSTIQLPGGKTDLDQLTDEELNDYLAQVQKTIDKYYIKLYNSSQSTFAQIEDIWGNALKQIFELDEESAKNTYNLWQKTFKSIADARKSLLNGDAIMKDMQGDVDSQANILRYLMETKGYSYEKAKAYMRDPDANYKELQFEAFGATQKSGLLSGADSPFYDEKNNKLLLDEYRGLSDEQIMQKYRSGMREYTASALMGSQDSFLNYLSMMKQHSGDSDESLAAYNTLMATSGELNGQQISLKDLIKFDDDNLVQVADGHSFEDIMNAIFSPETIALWAKHMGYQTVEQIKQAMYEAGAQANDSEYMFDRSKVDEYRQAFTDLTEQELHNYMKTVKEAGLITGKTTEELEYNAAVLYRQSKGFDNAQSNMSKYQKTLKQISKNLGENRKYSNEYTKTLDNVREIYADLLELTPQESQELSEAFLTSTKNAKLLEKAIKGDEKAWDQLTAAAADDILSLKTATDQIIVGTDAAGNALEGQMSDLIGDIQSWLDGQQLEVGATINDADFISKCETLVNQCANTAQEASAALSSLGVEAEIEEHRVPVPPKDKEVVIEGGHYQVPVMTGNGFEIQDVPISATIHETDGGQEYVWYTLKGSTYNGRGVTHGGASTPKSNGGGGGGGKQHTKKEHKRVNKEGERYHEIRDKLEQQEHILDRIDKIKDRAYGGRHLKALNAEIKALEKQNKLQEEYYAEAAAYLASDRAELTHYGATFNSDGTVNYDEYIRKQVNWYNAAVDASNDDETDERIEKEYEDRMKALENYEEALDLVDSIQNDILENQNKISEILLEGIQYKLEIAVELNDRDIKKLDYYINKWSDLLNKQDESMEVAMMKMQDYESSLAAVNEAYNTLQSDYASGKLNDQDYAEALGDLQDKTLEYLESINDLKKEISDYYENTLSLAEEKEQKYADKIEHTRNMMQSYIEMQQLMGRGQNFAELNSIYETSYRSSLLTAKAARDYLDTLYASRAAIIREIENSGWTETLKAQYDSVEEHIINAEDDLASKTQQTLEDAKSKFQNTIDAILKATDLAFKSLVDANGNLIMSFDEVAQDFNYWNEQQGWYVSTAKELYEVSKINRQIDDSIMDSTTMASKERLKALRNEINAYAEKNRLTEYDIEMNELQYKMALAMQNLEDTKNAKSTVRLTRDENGNYGYQYTANEDDVSAARQNFEDVLQQINELSYEHQNDLIQQMIESKQNYQSELKEILDDDTLALEERNRQAETLTSQHLAQMEYIQEQGMRAQEQLLENQGYIQEYYGKTIIENTGLVQDQIHGMMQQLMQDSSGYVDYIRTTLRQQLDQAIGGYSGDIAEVGDETGLTWDAMEDSVIVYNHTNQQAAENIKTLDQILGDSLANISSATAAWTAHNAELEKTVQAYELLYSKMQSIQNSLVDLDSVADRYYNNGAIKRPNELGTTSALNTLYRNTNNTNFTDNQFEASPNALGRLHNTTMKEYDISSAQLWNSIDMVAINGLLGLIDRGIKNNIQGNSSTDALSQQVVNINANFDNIQSAQDIIDAFNQLTNLASQYAYTSGS